jgi:putative RNA 2'-phosphotransferase
MRKRNLIKLSKFLALILRHQPERFALELDDEGWVSLSEVLEILRGLPNFRWATRADVMEVVEEGTGDGKRRFEVQGKRIRACYGHTLNVKRET